VLSVADALIVASKVDGVILVVKAGSTPKEIISSANLQLVRSGACVLGAAANHVNLKDPEYHYYRRYYSDKRYTQKTGTGKPPIIT
jgi:Mrp family chromosome partitioning ATPase